MTDETVPAAISETPDASDSARVGRAMTLRLDADLADLLDLLAAVTGSSASRMIRSAIRTYARDVRRSPKFQAMAAQYLDRQRWLLLEAGPVDPWMDSDPDAGGPS